MKPIVVDSWQDLKQVNADKEFLINEIKRLNADRDFLIKEVERLQETLDRVRSKKQGKDTIKVCVYYDDVEYTIDTKLKTKNLVEGQSYYLADSYKEPTKVDFIGWDVSAGIDQINIFASCYNYTNDKIEYYNPSSLYKSKSKASDAYLAKKERK